MSIAENLKSILLSLPAHVKLVAVSKTHPVEKVKEAYAAGQRAFGENKVQEMMAKQPLLPSDIEWHLIGHLQSNKVKYIAPFVSLIHSADSIKLIAEIDKQARKCSRVIDILIQVHIAEEETKFGFSLQECEELFNSRQLLNFANIRIRGLMGMATNTDDESKIRREFHSLKRLFEKLRSSQLTHFDVLSMGMSSDYKIAIEEGSTLIRVGSLIFGEREYLKHV